MTHSQKLDFIRQKAIEANPSIVELKFGTPVKLKIQDDWFKDPDRIYHIKGQNKSSVSESWELVEVFQAGFHPSCFEILGRDITLADIIFLLKKKWQREIKSVRQKYENQRAIIGLLNLWNLFKPLHEQDGLTVSFIYELLK